MECAGLGRQVIDELSPALQKLRIFGTEDALSDKSPMNRRVDRLVHSRPAPLSA